MSESYRHIVVTPLSAGLGAEIAGLDLREPLSDAVFVELRRAYDRFGMIAFRDQDLSPEEHIAFAERWGDIDVNRFFSPVAGHPQVAEVRKDPEDDSNIGGTWHTDHSYDPVPAMGSLLYARELPSCGGDTLFASTAVAYRALSPGLQRTLEGMKAIHSSRHFFGQGPHARDSRDHGRRFRKFGQEIQEALHPVVITHPRSGEKMLYVNPLFTVRFEGWSEAESKPLLDYLFAQATRPEGTCRFAWREGSMVFWDNLATWHYALNDYPGQRRVMHRITLEGQAF